jgi:hypothetical protein
MWGRLVFLIDMLGFVFQRRVDVLSKDVLATEGTERNK